MAREFSKSFYNSKAWLKSRRGYIDTVGGLCERCKAKGKFEPGKIVHHKTYLSEENMNDVSITLDWNNFEYLCQDCHNIEHHAVDSIIRDGIMFDENGNMREV